MTFEQASRVTRKADDRWVGEVAAGWDIVGNANGGYVLAMAARALGGAAGRPDPVTVTAHYLTPVRPGPIEVQTEVEKSGKRFATVRGRLTADGRPALAVLGTFGDLRAADGPERIEGEPPDLPGVEACVAIEPTDTFPPPFMGRVDLRMHPEDAGFVKGEPSGRPEMRGWFRLPDGEPIDPYALLLAVDAFPPTVFNARLPVAWTPTLELTAHVRRHPAPGWLRCVFRSRFIAQGFLEADGEIWDESGHLVAQSRQLALAPRKP